MWGKIKQILFLTIVLFLPTQLGKHFWPEFSYIFGTKIDYLSPTIYFNDILITLLIFLEAKIIFKKISGILKQRVWFFVLIPVFLIAILGSSLVWQLSLLKLLRIIEYSVFGLLVWIYFQKNNRQSGFFIVFSFGALFESILAIYQFFFQKSFGGIFWLLGERFFNSATPQIAQIEIFNGLYARPYGTFPHPNVLAGYLSAVVLLIAGYLINKNRKKISFKEKSFYIVTLFFSVTAVFISFSRTGWFFLATSSLLFFLTSGTKNKLKYFLGIGLGLLLISKTVLFSLVSQRLISLFTDDAKSVYLRASLNEAAIKIISSHPLFGAGLNNFIPAMSIFYHWTGELRSYQPVHNIYLLLLSEAGITGLAVFLMGVGLTFKNLINHKNLLIKNGYLIIIFAGLLLVGLFDHYLLTLPQGQLLLALMIGLCFVNEKKTV